MRSFFCLSLVVFVCFLSGCILDDDDDTIVLPASLRFKSSSSEEPSSSSSEPPSSSSAEITLNCGSMPTVGTSGYKIPVPALTCSNGATPGTPKWTNAPDWDNPALNTYSDVSVEATCGGLSRTADCSGTLTVTDEITLTCASVPSSGYEGTEIKSPAVYCNGSDDLGKPTWSANAPLDWNNPASGTYSDVKATATCGSETKTANCSGTLTVSAVTLTCDNVPEVGTSGHAIPPPVLTCNHGTLGTPTWINAPNWSTPVSGIYDDVSVTANCGGLSRTADCSGTLTVTDEITLTCANVPSSGYEGTEINLPYVSCNGATLGTLTWSENAPNWSNPEPKTYSNISVTATCGSETKTANCGGTLVVDAVTLTCTGMPAEGTSGIAITEPTVSCDHGTRGTVAWTDKPDWSNPVAKTYNVSATATCGLATKTADCGTLVVSPQITLTCANVPSSGYEGTAITQPDVACNGGTLGTLTWSASAPNWNNPVAKTYSNISVTATCGSETKTANCGGTLVVNAVTLDCIDMPAEGIAGLPIDEPNVSCSHGTRGTVAWTDKPDWSNPVAKTYNVSATATCGSVTKTATCALTVRPCTANDNNDTHYCYKSCSDKTMKAYGDLFYGNKHYKTVVIGTQTWMAENLNHDPGKGKSACYGNIPSNCEIYGRLYDWATAMDIEAKYNSEDWDTDPNPNHSDVNYKGICPDDWHLPNSYFWEDWEITPTSDWTILMHFVESDDNKCSDDMETNLKSITTLWNSNTPGTDDYGFSALPGGRHTGTGIEINDNDFKEIHDLGMWWSATGRGEDDAAALWILNDSYMWYPRDKPSLASVRCVKNK